MMLVNALVDHTPLKEHASLRSEWLALHPTSPKAFLEMIDKYSRSDDMLYAQLDIFIEMLR